MRSSWRLIRNDVFGAVDLDGKFEDLMGGGFMSGIDLHLRIVYIPGAWWDAKVDPDHVCC